MSDAFLHPNRRRRLQQLKTIPSVFPGFPALPKTADLSLVFFTLLTQIAVGLVFVGTIGQWLDKSMSAGVVLRTPALALGLLALGLLTALVHLAAPRRAPLALRNPGTSWLSREVLLVPVFALALVFSMAAQKLGSSTALVVLEITTLCLGGAALRSMTGVYLIKSVPAWDSPATTLEFMGTALLPGGALSMALSSFGTATGWGPAFTIAATGMCLGLLLKLAAIHPGIAAEHRGRSQVWYSLPATVFSAAQSRAIRAVSNAAGVVLILMGAARGSRGELFTGLFILLATEAAGRLRFFRLYGRIGP